MTAFYLESKAPKVIKSSILKLLSRLIKKLRLVYTSDPVGESIYTAAKHFDLQFVNNAFTTSLINELSADMNLEQRHQNEKNASEGTILYSLFVQNGAEFIMNLVVPCYRNAIVLSYLDLAKHCIPQLPEWIDGLIKF